MCRKVVLTKAQAEEFESFKKLRNGLEEWARDKYDPNAPNSVIHNLTFDDVAHAYYIGYEIEPEQPKFQPGDKVMKVDGHPFPGGMKIRDLTAIYESWHICDGESRNNPIKYRESELRHATPEEIYWMETLGREKVGDFRIGDIFIECDGEGFAIYTSGLLDRAYCMYAAGNFQGLHPADSFRLFKKDPE